MGCPSVAGFGSCEIRFESLRLASAVEATSSEKDNDVIMSILFGCSTALPPFSIEQGESAMLAQSLGLSRRWNKALPGLYKKSGVNRRGSVLLVSGSGEPMTRQDFYKAASEHAPFGPTTSQRMHVYAQHAAELLRQSCEKTLAVSRVAVAAVTHLVTISCTGFYSPGVDHTLIDRLGLDPQVQRTHVGFMGCHGLLNGLRVANALSRSEPQGMVLVAAVELCSIHQQYSEDPQQMVANSLFADGAASCLVVSREIQMMLSPEVPLVIERELKGPFEKWLNSNQLSQHDIQGWAVHPGGPRILDSVENGLGLSPTMIQASRHVLAHHGNMSSPTVFFVLQELEMQILGMQNCVLLGFGPGLHVEAILLKRESVA
jgi:predicted naringenin-chalcone synthase